MKAVIECPDCFGNCAVPCYIPNEITLVSRLDELPYVKCGTCNGVGKIVIDIGEVESGHTSCFK